MLFVRWNKNGTKAVCEDSQLEEMEKNGFDLTECPCVEEVEEKIVEESKEKVEEVPAPKKSKPRKKKESKAKPETDSEPAEIVL